MATTAVLVIVVTAVIWTRRGHSPTVVVSDGATALVNGSSWWRSKSVAGYSTSGTLTLVGGNCLGISEGHGASAQLLLVVWPVDTTLASRDHTPVLRVSGSDYMVGDVLNLGVENVFDSFADTALFGAHEVPQECAGRKTIVVDEVTGQ